MGDFNGDGFDDKLENKQGGQWIQYGSESGLLESVNVNELDDNIGWLIGDINGDGKADGIQVHDSHLTIITDWESGLAKEYAFKTIGISQEQAQTLALLDINNDSISELISVGETTYTAFSFLGEMSHHVVQGESDIEGSSRRDIIFGSAGDDTILGRAGNDVIVASEGRDDIDGGRGQDTISYATIDQGVSIILVDDGEGEYTDNAYYAKDVLGSVSEDILVDFENAQGSVYADEIFGNSEMNKLYGLSGDDRLFSGAGNDTIWGGLDNDILHGESGNDYLYGELGNDILIGGEGDDWLEGGLGNDVLFGQEGADRFIVGNDQTHIMDFNYADGDRIDLTGFSHYID